MPPSCQDRDRAAWHHTMARGQLCPDLLGQNQPGTYLDLKSLASRLSVDGVL
jgi:hypothetical protein